jgi:hypothetical protein
MRVQYGIDAITATDTTTSLTGEGFSSPVYVNAQGDYRIVMSGKQSLTVGETPAIYATVQKFNTTKTTRQRR